MELMISVVFSSLRECSLKSLKASHTEHNAVEDRGLNLCIGALLLHLRRSQRWDQPEMLVLVRGKPNDDGELQSKQDDFTVGPV